MWIWLLQVEIGAAGQSAGSSAVVDFDAAQGEGIETQFDLEGAQTQIDFVKLAVEAHVSALV